MKPGSADAEPLTRLRPGQSGRILHIAPDRPELMVKLSSLGLLPGAIVSLQQTRPAAVIRVAETSVALDPDIAARILVEPL